MCIFFRTFCLLKRVTFSLSATFSRGILLEAVSALLATTAPLVLHLLSPAPQALILSPRDWRENSNVSLALLECFVAGQRWQHSQMLSAAMLGKHLGLCAFSMRGFRVFFSFLIFFFVDLSVLMGKSQNICFALRLFFYFKKSKASYFSSSPEV